MTFPIIQDGDTQREMTSEEHEAWLAGNAETQQIKEAAAAKEAERRAVLAKLGLTDDEINLILGV